MNRTVIASLLAGVAVAALASAPSFAADLGPAAPPQTYVAPPAPVAGYDWTGFYVGINGGYGWGDFHNSAGLPLGGGDGGLVGGTLGYNWQFGHFVAGLETDFDWADITKNDGFGDRGRLGYLGTVRGRLGYAFDRVLLYGTGGLAYGDTHFRQIGVGSDSQTQLGWTSGGGIEYALWRNISAKIEYRYTDLGRDNVANAGLRGGYRGSTVLAGINYTFW